jgi:hypothetical protein
MLGAAAVIDAQLTVENREQRTASGKRYVRREKDKHVHPNMLR